MRYDKESSESARTNLYDFGARYPPVLGNPIRTSRYHRAELVPIGISEHDPTYVAFSDTSHEVATKLESSLGHVVRIVRVEVNVAAARRRFLVVGELKCQVGPSAGGITQSQE